MNLPNSLTIARMVLVPLLVVVLLTEFEGSRIAGLPKELVAASMSDVYRLSVATEGDGWSAALQNALAAVPFGSTKAIPVFISRSAKSATTATVTVTAVSETDPSKKASYVYKVR